MQPRLLWTVTGWGQRVNQHLLLIRFFIFGLINRLKFMSSGINITIDIKGISRMRPEWIVPADVLAGGGNWRPGETAWSVDWSRAPCLWNKTQAEKFNYRNSHCIIQQTVSNHISCDARTASWVEKIISLSCLNMILTGKARARHALMHRMIKRKNTILAVNLSD